MSKSLCLGQPRFQDPSLKQVHEREGVVAAWRRAFSDDGASAPGKVQGDFAIAVETPDQGTFLAVDKFAIRTLCYRVADGRLLFAERADALADATPDLDPQAIFDYLYFHIIPSPRTVFRDVFRVPPGHCVHFHQGRLNVAPYWRPAFTEDAGCTFAELRSEFLSLLETAVATRLGSGATGCYLSGGTDSSTVAGMATRLGGRPAETYSIGFDAEGYDEMEYARIAARHFGTRHHEYYVTPDDLVTGMPLVAASYDQAFGNSSAVPAYYCALRAKQDGIDSLLAGDGGDELFAGNTRYAKQQVFAAYGRLPAPLRRGVIEPALVDSGVLDHVPLLRKGASYVRQARVPMPERMQTYNLLFHLGLDEVLSPGFLAAIEADEPRRHQAEVYASCPPASLTNHMLYFDWRYTLAENDLPKVVGSAALAGIDSRFPLLDDRLLDFSLKLPTSWKLRRLKLRWFFKEALRGFLPDEVITKKKHGFGLPFGPWAVEHGPLRTLAADALHALADRDLVRRPFVDTLLQRHLPAHPGFYGELVWILAMLELWLRRHAPSYRMPDA